MARRSVLPQHAPAPRAAPPTGRFMRRVIALLVGVVLLGAFVNVAFMKKVDERETLEAAAFAEISEHARMEAHAKLLTEAEQQAIEAEALQEAIAAPLLGADGEDRSRPAPREESGAGRRDEIHARHHSNDHNSHHQVATTGVELPSDPELPEDDDGGRPTGNAPVYLGPAPPPPPQPPPSSRPPPSLPHQLPGQKMVEIGGCPEDQYGKLLMTKTQFEASWGGCWTDGGREVLVALPYSADMLCELQRLMFTRLKAMECANPGFNLRLALYDKPYVNNMNADKTKKSGRGVLATLRNALLAEYLEPAHELVLWLDADVVEYPADLVAQLYAANPGGVSAPLVLIEESDTEAFHTHLCKKPLCHMGMQRHTRHITQWSDRRYKQFYDRAAFIASSTNITMTKAFPGNSLPFPPYLGGVDGWTEALASGTVECESVGTVYMIPAEVYRSTCSGKSFS